MFDKRFWKEAKECFLFTWEYRYIANEPCNREDDPFCEHDALQLAVIAVYDFLRMFAQAAICEVFDHSYVDDSWAGPDSGGEGWYCNRCGRSWSHTYY